MQRCFTQIVSNFFKFFRNKCDDVFSLRITFYTLDAWIKTLKENKRVFLQLRFIKALSFFSSTKTLLLLLLLSSFVMLLLLCTDVDVVVIKLSCDTPLTKVFSVLCWSLQELTLVGWTINVSSFKTQSNSENACVNGSGYSDYLLSLTFFVELTKVIHRCTQLTS